MFLRLSLSLALSSGLDDPISSRLLDPCVWGYGPASPHGSPACCLSPALCSNFSNRSRWKEHWEAVPSPQAPLQPSLDRASEGGWKLLWPNANPPQSQLNPAARSSHSGPRLFISAIYSEDSPRDPDFKPYQKPLPIQPVVPSLGCRVGSRGPLSKGHNLLTLN